MGVDDSSGAAANAMLQPKGPCPGTSSASKGSRSSSGSLDICGSISEYLLQLHAAAPSLHPVPCASFFTAQTTVKDLADCSASGGISSSSMARDLLASVSQHQAEGNAKAFKAFARSFHAAATQRLAGAKVCSVCAAVRQQKQQQEEQEGYGQWGLCLLPHLDPSQQVKSFSLPQVACGRCLGVLRLSELLTAAAANVSGAPLAQADSAGPLAAALKHFISVNSQKGVPGGPLRYCRDGSNSSREGQQKTAATGTSSFRDLPPDAQRRALDISLATAFSIHLLSKEVPWKLRGPAGSQQQLVDSLAASPAAADAVPNAVMAPIKSEPQEASQRASKKIQKQQEQKQPQGKPHKKKQGSKDSGSTGNYAATNTAEPQTEGSPIKRKAASGFVGSAKGHERQQYPKQKQQGQGNEGKKARHS